MPEYKRNTVFYSVWVVMNILCSRCFQLSCRILVLYIDVANPVIVLMYINQQPEAQPCHQQCSLVR